MLAQSRVCSLEASSFIRLLLRLVSLFKRYRFPFSPPVRQYCKALPAASTRWQLATSRCVKAMTAFWLFKQVPSSRQLAKICNRFSHHSFGRAACASFLVVQALAGLNARSVLQFLKGVLLPAFTSLRGPVVGKQLCSLCQDELPIHHELSVTQTLSSQRTSVHPVISSKSYHPLRPSRRREPPPDKGASQVLEWLFVGGARAASSSSITSLGIAYVLNCCELLRFSSSETFNKRLSFKDEKTTLLAPLLPDAFAFIDEARQQDSRILVHCRHGVSRSVSIVLAYLMAREGQSLREALELVQKIRPVSRPNSGFAVQLSDLELVLRGRSSIVLSELAHPSTQLV